MGLEIYAYRKYLKYVDGKRNAAIEEPAGVNSIRGLRYMSGYGKWHTLDVFRPDATKNPLPLIVEVHGGGWVYGDKEIYHLYAKDLARRGFAVISFNYVRAPRKKFPYQLKELDNVLAFAKENAELYGFDLSRVYLFGDSAGANLSAMYAAASTNPEYGKLFDFSYPLKIAGLGLACGLYRKLGMGEEKELKMLYRYYLGKHFDKDDPRFDLFGHITSAFPRSYLFSAEKDIPFVSEDNVELDKLLTSLGVEHEYKVYTSKEGNLSHVFHCNIKDENAILANDEQTSYFFRKK
jgi:acetyl esterase/lipase